MLFRSELVCNAIHEKHTLFLAVKKLFFGLGKCLASYNYGSVKYITRAFDDYLRGTDFFLNTDEEKLNEKLRGNSETLLDVNMLNLPNNTKVRKKSKNRRFLRVITLNGYLIPSRFLKRENKVVPWACAHAYDFFGYKNIIEYDAANDRGAVRTMKKRWLFIGARIFIKYSLKLLIKNRKTVSEYRHRMGEITSTEFWREHLDIKES